MDLQCIELPFQLCQMLFFFFGIRVQLDVLGTEYFDWRLNYFLRALVRTQASLRARIKHSITFLKEVSIVILQLEHVYDLMLGKCIQSLD